MWDLSSISFLLLPHFSTWNFSFSSTIWFAKLSFLHRIVFVHVSEIMLTYLSLLLGSPFCSTEFCVFSFNTATLFCHCCYCFVFIYFWGWILITTFLSSLSTYLSSLSFEFTASFSFSCYCMHICICIYVSYSKCW